MQMMGYVVRLRSLEEGRQACRAKITQYTRFATLGLALSSPSGTAVAWRVRLARAIPSWLPVSASSACDQPHRRQHVLMWLVSKSRDVVWATGTSILIFGGIAGLPLLRVVCSAYWTGAMTSGRHSTEAAVPVTYLVEFR